MNFQRYIFHQKLVELQLLLRGTRQVVNIVYLRYINRQIQQQISVLIKPNKMNDNTQQNNDSDIFRYILAQNPQFIEQECLNHTFHGPNAAFSNSRLDDDLELILNDINSREVKDVEENCSSQKGLSSTPDQVQQSCKCTKSQCLKLYCVCFHNDRPCNSNCACENCHNSEENQPKRKQLVTQAIKKRPNSATKLFDTSTIEGCNCLQTKCTKNYCECFIRGLMCTSKCKCYKCKNGNPISLQKKPKRKPKRIFRFNLP